METVPTSESSPAPLAILVVDDDGFVRDLVADILTSAGHTVETAVSGAEALRMIEASRDSREFSLILSDVNMPEVSGLELIRTLREAKVATPIIMMTGDQDIALAVAALKSGADDYLLKNEEIAETVLISIDQVVEKYRLKAENARLMLDLACKKQELERLSSYEWLKPHMTLQRLPKGTVVCQKGDAADMLFLVEKGELRIPEFGVVIGEGKVFGEAGLFSRNHLRTATVVCATDAEVYSLSNDKFPELIAGTPTFLVELMKLALGHSMENLARTAAAKEKIESELQVASEIQLSMLPRNFPAFPGREEVDVYATMIPAKEVGGDLYDLFAINDHTFCFIVGDVSGKGVPAALYMAISKTLLKSEALKGQDPGTVLRNVNAIICPDNTECMFITVLCAILDVRTGELRYANAGHNPPLLSRQGGGFDFVPVTPNCVLGVLDSAEFENQKIVLEPGDLFFMYTDGVNEAMNASQEQFDYQRLVAGLNGMKESSLQEMIAAVGREIEAFADGVDQSDDITMLAFRYRKPMAG